MKKILIQYLYIFVIASVILFFFTWASACEVEQVDETLPLCEEYQISTEEKPCKKNDVSISTIGEAIKKLGESGTLPK